MADIDWNELIKRMVDELAYWNSIDEDNNTNNFKTVDYGIYKIQIRVTRRIHIDL